MIKINEMNPGKETVGFEAIIISVTVGKTNGANKSSYLNIVLQDATGTIDAKLWSATDEQIRLFERGQVVRGKGDIINYKGTIQMKIVKLDHDIYFDNVYMSFHIPVSIKTMYVHEKIQNHSYS